MAQGQGAPQGAPQGSQQAEALLQQAEKFYEQLEYETALQSLIRVHQAKGVSLMQRARSFLYMGVCFTAIGKAEDAVQSFMALLKIKPDFRLPNGVSPSIRAMFKEALSRLKLPAQGAPPQAGGQQGGAAPAKVPVQLEATAPRKVRAGRPIEVTIKLKDPSKLVSVLQIRWRRRKGPDFSTIKVKVKPGQAEVKARIPGALVGRKKGRVLYFVEAMARGGMTLAYHGSMDDPLMVRLKKGKAKSSNVKWWIIGVGAGLAVVGGVVAAVVLTRPDSPPPVFPKDVQPPIVLK